MSTKKNQTINNKKRKATKEEVGEHKNGSSSKKSRKAKREESGSAPPPALPAMSLEPKDLEKEHESKSQEDEGAPQECPGDKKLWALLQTVNKEEENRIAASAGVKLQENGYGRNTVMHKLRLCFLKHNKWQPPQTTTAAADSKNAAKADSYLITSVSQDQRGGETTLERFDTFDALMVGLVGYECALSQDSSDELYFCDLQYLHYVRLALAVVLGLEETAANQDANERVLLQCVQLLLDYGYRGEYGWHWNMLVMGDAKHVLTSSGVDVVTSSEIDDVEMETPVDLHPRHKPVHETFKINRKKAAENDNEEG